MVELRPNLSFPIETKCAEDWVIRGGSAASDGGRSQPFQ